MFRSYTFLAVLLSPLFVPTVSVASASTGFEQLIESSPLDAGVSSSIHAAQLTHYLEQNGYLLAVVHVVEDGTLEVNPGTISNISVTGLNPKNEVKVKGIIAAQINEIPLQADFDRALALINDLPGVSATFALERVVQSEYTLHVNAQETNGSGGILIDHSPRNLGDDYRINLHQSFNSLITGGDVLRLQAVWLDSDSNSQQQYLSLSYQFKLGSEGAFAEVGYSDFKSDTNIQSRPTSFTTGFGTVILPGSTLSRNFDGQHYYVTGGFPIKRTHDEAFYAIGQLDYSVDKTQGIGESDVTHGDLGLFYNTHAPGGSSFYVGGYLGLGRSDSYVDSDNGHYWSAEFAIGYITPLPQIDRFTELRIEGFGKIADKHLPNSKLFSLGDEDFLRGYAASSFVGNNGFSASIELAHAYYLDNRYVNRVSPFVFLDVGYVANDSGKSNTNGRPNSAELMSTGVGVSAVFAHNLTADVYIGMPLMDDSTGTTPDPETFLRLGWRW